LNSEEEFLCFVFNPCAVTCAAEPRGGRAKRDREAGSEATLGERDAGRGGQTARDNFCRIAKIELRAKREGPKGRAPGMGRDKHVTKSGGSRVTWYLKQTILPAAAEKVGVEVFKAGFFAPLSNDNKSCGHCHSEVPKGDEETRSLCSAQERGLWVKRKRDVGAPQAWAE